MPFQKGHKINLGKHWINKIPMSEKTKKKLSDFNKGKKLSETTKRKMSKRMEGNQYGLGRRNTEEQKRRIGLRSKNPSKETRIKMSLSHKGEKCHLWKGGITPINSIIRTSLEYKLWRKSVFERDNYACIWCGTKSGNGKAVKLHADHIQTFSEYPELRFAIDNGRTLCKECHYKRHHTKL